MSNCEIAKQIGVCESSIRQWKKHPVWEETKAKILHQYAEVLEPMSEQEKNEFREKLQERQRELEIFRNALKENTAQCFKVTNQAYRDLGRYRDPIKACSDATRSGIHIQSKNAMDGLRTMMLIDEHTYQLNVIIENFQELDLDDDDEE